ncbi:MAG TPA: Ig-like domain-containing protein [Gemmatimonadota bacterium]|nr:Ig-like domain-containing protein [Gemmatimonadota bacterium]
MPTSLRFFFALALPLSMLAACGTDRESASPVDTTLELTGVADFCPPGDIDESIAAIFPATNSVHHVATVRCGQVFSDFGKGKQTEAARKAFAFFVKSLEQNEAGDLLVSGAEGEAEIVELFALILAGIGVDLPDVDPGDLADALLDGEFGVGELVPGGPPLLTVSLHAGIGDPGGGLFGPVTAIIIKIPPAESDIELASLTHPCPAGVDNSFDCYPLFFDYSVSPESNVNPAVGLQLGQCNVSPSGVEVLLLSPEGFLPEDDAPTGIDCTDVEPEEEVAMTGWRRYAWAVLEPISPLFRVSKAFAGKSPIGGRISAFSPVAPADPESGEPSPNATQTSLTPESDQSFSGEIASFTATVTEALSEDPVNVGTVRFTVSGIEFNQEFETAVEGSASMNVGCNTDGAGDIDVPFGNYTITAEYLENATHASSSDPEPSTLTCSEIVIG